ncbi:hypothetical protein CXG81DRAFT_27712 [Caulochytrium protostelioides]|uniref:Uncharacterized protein n=1 Tax=Caulochytrium protostelioides TaxID=1555241 RepID=A0A4P9X3E3_9FUNG|nr:hypothetical protein CXG81DRAFT_27712 [Caulochytrium protostelioides]|eukprot:RKO99530.1 hypothetical protein CXG81DRAFT_27712 [Caulochytrium protostelioides]
MALPLPRAPPTAGASGHRLTIPTALERSLTVPGHGPASATDAADADDADDLAAAAGAGGLSRRATGLTRTGTQSSYGGGGGTSAGVSRASTLLGAPASLFRNTFARLSKKPLYTHVREDPTARCKLRVNEHYAAVATAHGIGILPNGPERDATGAHGPLPDPVKLELGVPVCFANPGADKHVVDLSWSPAVGHVLASCARRDCVVRVWRVPAAVDTWTPGTPGATVASADLYLAGHESAVQRVAFHPTVGNLLASAGADAADGLRLWEVEGMAERAAYPNIAATAFVFDATGRHLVAINRAMHTLDRFDVRSGQRRQSLPLAGLVHPTKHAAVAWLHPDPYVVVAGFDPAPSADRRLVVIDLRRGAVVQTVPVAATHGAGLGALTPLWDPALPLLYVTAKDEGVRVYEWADSQLGLVAATRSERAFTAMDLLPKSHCVSRQCEIARFAGLSADHTLDTVSILVPRQRGETEFQQAFYPPIAVPPPCTAADFFRSDALRRDEGGEADWLAAPDPAIAPVMVATHTGVDQHQRATLTHTRGGSDAALDAAQCDAQRRAFLASHGAGDAAAAAAAAAGDPRHSVTQRRPSNASAARPPSVRGAEPSPPPPHVLKGDTATLGAEPAAAPGLQVNAKAAPVASARSALLLDTASVQFYTTTLTADGRLPAPRPGASTPPVNAFLSAASGWQIPPDTRGVTPLLKKAAVVLQPDRLLVYRSTKAYMDDAARRDAAASLKLACLIGIAVWDATLVCVWNDPDRAAGTIAVSVVHFERAQLVPDWQTQIRRLAGMGETDAAAMDAAATVPAPAPACRIGRWTTRTRWPETPAAAAHAAPDQTWIVCLWRRGIVALGNNVVWSRALAIPATDRLRMTPEAATGMALYLVPAGRPGTAAGAGASDAETADGPGPPPAAAASRGDQQAARVHPQTPWVRVELPTEADRDAWSHFIRHLSLPDPFAPATVRSALLEIIAMQPGAAAAARPVTTVGEAASAAAAVLPSWTRHPSPLALWMITGKGGQTVTYVKPHVASLRRDAAFVLCTPHAAYYYAAPGCSRVAAARALELAVGHQRSYVGLRVETVLVETLAAAPSAMVSALQTDAAKLSAPRFPPSMSEGERAATEDAVRVWQLTWPEHADGTLEPAFQCLHDDGALPDKALLQSDRTILYSGRRQLYLWQGRDVPRDLAGVSADLVSRAAHREVEPGLAALARALQTGHAGGAAAATAASHGPATTPVAAVQALRVWVEHVQEGFESMSFKTQFTGFPSSLPISMRIDDVKGHVAAPLEQPPLQPSTWLVAPPAPVCPPLASPTAALPDRAELEVAQWRVVDFQRERVPDKRLGHLVTTDNYLVTMRRAAAAGAGRGTLFFWQGGASRLIEKGTNAMLVAEATGGGVRATAGVGTDAVGAATDADGAVAAALGMATRGDPLAAGDFAHARVEEGHEPLALIRLLSPLFVWQQTIPTADAARPLVLEIRWAHGRPDAVKVCQIALMDVTFCPQSLLLVLTQLPAAGQPASQLKPKLWVGRDLPFPPSALGAQLHPVLARLAGMLGCVAARPPAAGSAATGTAPGTPATATSTSTSTSMSIEQVTCQHAVFAPLLAGAPDLATVPGAAPAPPILLAATAHTGILQVVRAGSPLLAMEDLDHSTTHVLITPAGVWVWNAEATARLAAVTAAAAGDGGGGGADRGGVHPLLAAALTEWMALPEAAAYGGPRVPRLVLVRRRAAAHAPEATVTVAPEPAAFRRWFAGWTEMKRARCFGSLDR